MNAIERLLSDPNLAPGIKEWVKPARWYRYFHQSTHWVPDGRPAVEITTMDLSWRLNCTRYLERNAERYSRLYASGCRAEEFVHSFMGAACGDPSERVLDHLESESHRARYAPATWIKTTPLYRALAADLPTGGKKLRKLGERARHWADCPRRLSLKGPECICPQLAAQAREQKARRDLELAEATRPWE